MRSMSPSLLLSPLLALSVAVAPMHAAVAAPAKKPKPVAADEVLPDMPPPGEEPAAEPTPPPATTPPPADPSASPEAEPPADTQTPTGEPVSDPSAPAEDGAAEPPAAAPPEEPPAAEPPPPEVSPEDLKPAEPRVGDRPRTGKGLMIAGGAVLGVGIASTITAVAMTRGCKIDGPLNCRLQEQDKFLIPLGVSVTLLGAMLLAVGGGYYSAYRKWESWTPERAAQEEKRRKNKKRRGKKKASAMVAPTLLQGGAGLGALGRF